MDSTDRPGKADYWAMLGACHRDQPDNCAWDVIVEARSEVNQSINLAVDRDIGSAVFHGNLVQVEQVK